MVKSNLRYVQDYKGAGCIILCTFSKNYQSSWKRLSSTGNVYWGKTTKVHESDYLVQGMYSGEKLPKFMKTIIYYRECIRGKNYQSSWKRSSTTGNV